MKSDVICLCSNLCCNYKYCLVVPVQDVSKWEWLITSDLDYNTSWFNKIISPVLVVPQVWYHPSTMITARNVWVWMWMCTCTNVKSSLQYECVTAIWILYSTTTIWTVTCEFSKQYKLSFFTRYITLQCCVILVTFLNQLTSVDVETLQVMLTQPQFPVSENPGTKLNLMHNRSRERAHTHTHIQCTHRMGGVLSHCLLTFYIPGLVPRPPQFFLFFLVYEVELNLACWRAKNRGGLGTKVTLAFLNNMHDYMV